MRFGALIAGGAVEAQVQLARAAEGAGWDGVFTWDGIHVGDGMETYDPWVLMAAFACATSRVRIGAMITPLARRRPWKVARETATLDRLSGGRLVLCVGLGALDDSGFGGVGEPTDRRVRAERLDEALAILEGLWTGEPFGFEGCHHRFPPMAFRPTPVQRPRIPVWVVGAWPSERSLRRALRYDGLLPSLLPGGGQLTPKALAELHTWIAERRSLDGYEVVVEGTTPPEPAAATATVEPWREAGATWWIEADWTARDIEAVMARITAGPPRVPHPPGAM